MLSLVGHTPAYIAEEETGPPEFPPYNSVERAETSDPGEAPCLSPLSRPAVLHSAQAIASAFPFGISWLNVFSLPLSAHSLACLRLNRVVAHMAPRLATGGWLVLTRQESHPLYKATLPGRTARHHLSIIVPPCRYMIKRPFIMHPRFPGHFTLPSLNFEP